MLIVREQNDSDWELEDGTPLIKQLMIDIHAIPAARITSFNTKLDGEWVKENTKLDTSNGNIQLDMRNDLTIIEDIGRKDKYSLKELEERLGKSTDLDFGERNLSIDFDDAYLHCGDMKLKLKEVDLTYLMQKSMHLPVHIDFSKELVGVIEYLGKSSKTAIFKDRVVKDWSLKT